MPLSLRPRVVLRAADEIEAARALALHVALGRLLVVRVELQQRRVVRALLRLLRRGGRCLEPRLEIVLFRGGGHVGTPSVIVVLRRNVSCYFSANANARANENARHPTLAFCPHARDQARTNVRGRHRVAADGPARQPDDDLRRADVRASAYRSRGCAASSTERFLVFRRFRECAVADGGGCRTGAPTAHFDHRARTSSQRGSSGDAGERELQALVSTLMSHAARRATSRCGSSTSSTTIAAASALIARIHHCYADGIALVRVMLSMTDAGRDGPPAMPFEARERAAHAEDEPLDALSGPLTGVLQIGAQDRRRRWSKRAPPSGRSRAGRRAGGAGHGADARDREARADGRGFADALQGHARRRQARRMGRTAAARRSEDDRPRAGRVGQRRAAGVRRRGAARLPRRAGRSSSTA